MNTRSLSRINASGVVINTMISMSGDYEQVCQEKRKDMTNSKFNNRSYSNWYVLQVKATREFYVKDIIDRYTPWNQKAIVFTREILHFKNGNYIKIRVPLFPGYIFVYQNIVKVFHILREILSNEFVKPICLGGNPAKVTEEEMQLLLSSTDRDGLFRLSSGVKAGDQTIITKGPLKKLKGRIMFINEKKRKAKLKMFLFNGVVNVSLGIDIHEKCVG